tara:strand:- start:1443 stop:2039 length:597 start_codon:yes stop_codon:yes gene_type:complete
VIKNLQDEKSSEIYRLFTHTIIPRPIAWILTENQNKNYNLAPFSYFNAVSSSPPLFSVSIGRKQSGEPKDTLFNITNSKHCVVHIPSKEDAALVMDSSKSLEYGCSETESFSIETTPVQDWPLPRLKKAPIAYYCQFYQKIELGPIPQTLILLEAKSLYLDSKIEETLDPESIQPLARLGGKTFSSLGSSFDIHPSRS